MAGIEVTKGQNLTPAKYDKPKNKFANVPEPKISPKLSSRFVAPDEAKKKI